MTFNTTYKFETVFDTQLCSLLVQYLSVEDIFLNLAVLNRDYRDTVAKLKEYKLLWVSKFVNEFTSEEGLRTLSNDLDLIENDDHCKTYLVDHYTEYVSKFVDLNLAKESM